MTMEELFFDVYNKFKLHFYKDVFVNFGNREATLTTVETFCMEVIYAMNKPTISEFAKFVGISPPNAAYKVNCLVKKGYLNRIPSSADRREAYLEVTDKYLDYFNFSVNYANTVLQRMKDNLSKEDLESLTRILNIMTTDLMPEVPDFKNREIPQ